MNNPLLPQRDANLDDERSDPDVKARRDFLKGLVAGIAVGLESWMVGPVNAQTVDWRRHHPDPDIIEPAVNRDVYNEMFRQNFRRCVEVGFHYHDLGQYDGYYDEILSRFDAKQIVANLLRANADSCHIWAEAISDYYYGAIGDQLQLAHLHRSLRGRDLIKELSEEAKAHGISVLVYTSAHSSWEFARLHPESVMRDNEGKAVAPEICFNSKYFLELQKARSSYLLSKYEVSGMFFDMMNYPFDKLACYCETCSKLFREKYGIELPKAPERNDVWEKFLEFRYESNSRFARSLKTHLQAQFPDRVICFNYHGQMPFAWQVAFRPVGHANISDATVAEDFAMRFSQGYPSLTSAFLAGVRPGSVFQLMTDMTLGGYGDFTQRPVADLKWDLFTGKMRGGNVMVIEKILHDYSTRPAVYEMIGEAFREVQEKEPLFDHPPVREVGLYYSLRTRDWYDQYNSDAYERCVVGAYRALTDLHHQVEFVFDESATLERLQQFPVIFLANTALLTDSETGILRKYVEGGGSLLATWETGLYDSKGNLLKDYVIGDLLGVRFDGHVEQKWRTMFGEPDNQVEPWHFVRFNSGPWTADVHVNLDLPVIGRPVVMKANGAELFGDLRTALPGGRPPGTAGCSPWKAVGKALAVHQFGKGRAAYFPVPITCQYSTQRALSDYRNLIRNALRYLNPDREISVDAPPNVECVAMRGDQQDEYIVHLVGYWPRKNCKTYWQAPAPTTEIMEEPAIYRANIRLAKRIRNARAHNSDTLVRIEGQTVRIQTGQVHEAVIIET